MRTLTIKAVTLDSANGFMTSLADFQAQLIEAEDGAYLVEIALGRGDREVIALLNALEDYVTHRDDGPAEVGLGSQTYKLHPADPPSSITRGASED